MKFEEALVKVVEIEKRKNPQFDGFDETVGKAMAAAWNIVAVAENKLDDFVFIETNNFKSVPISSLFTAKADSGADVSDNEGADEEQIQEPETEPTEPEPTDDEGGDAQSSGSNQ
jgi:hypothetical protein